MPHDNITEVEEENKISETVVNPMLDKKVEDKCNIENVDPTHLLYVQSEEHENKSNETLKNDTKSTAQSIQADDNDSPIELIINSRGFKKSAKTVPNGSIAQFFPSNQKILKEEPSKREEKKLQESKQTPKKKRSVRSESSGKRSTRSRPYKKIMSPVRTQLQPMSLNVPTPAFNEGQHGLVPLNIVVGYFKKLNDDIADLKKYQQVAMESYHQKTMKEIKSIKAKLSEVTGNASTSKTSASKKSKLSLKQDQNPKKSKKLSKKFDDDDSEIEEVDSLGYKQKLRKGKKSVSQSKGQQNSSQPLREQPNIMNLPQSTINQLIQAQVRLHQLQQLQNRPQMMQNQSQLMHAQQQMMQNQPHLMPVQMPFVQQQVQHMQQPQQPPLRQTEPVQPSLDPPKTDVLLENIRKNFKPLKSMNK